MFTDRRLSYVPLLCLLLLASGFSAHAASPSIQFDFGRTADCRDVTPTVADEVYSDEKIVELKLRVSVQVTAGDISDVEEVRIEAVDCDGQMRVHSFDPSTRLESHVSEDIQWSKTTEKGSSIGASLGGEAPVLLGDVVAHVTPTINGGTTKREVVTETQRRIAPKHAVVTSGTLEKEHGVFFKLHRSSQASLEGVHELTIRFVVPESWRGDSVRVCCQATGQERFLWLKQDKTWAQFCAPVVIFLAGDEVARQAAERHLKRQSSRSGLDL